MCGACYDAVGGIEKFSLLRTLIGRLAAALDERRMHATRYLKQVC